MIGLRLIFRPRLWGSFESRWECGATHLMGKGDRTLCGESTGEAREEGTVLLNGPIPKRVCKRCQKAASRLLEGATEAERERALAVYR